MAEDRYLNLKRPAACSACRSSLSVGERAWWKSDLRTVTCCGCRPDISTAGGSAQREAERRHSRYEQQTHTAHPHIAGFLLRVRDEPQRVQAWRKGAEGERKLGAALNQVASASDRVSVLHDRRIPGSRANIDHIAVAPTGVYVIDAKRYAGKLERRDKGGMFRSDIRLYVGGNDRSKLLDGMDRQIDAVYRAIGPVAPIVPVLCFVDTDWGLFAKPFDLRGVHVTWGAALRKRLGGAGPLLPRGVTDLAERLEHTLPGAAPARSA